MSARALGVAVLSWSACAGVARAQCFDWSDEFQISGLGVGVANAQVVYDDGSGPALFVGGNFATIAGVPANGIAKWNGTQWTTFGDGVAFTASRTGVRALAVFDDGSGPQLYAGGEFTGIGGVAASNVARWDGTNWSPLGVGTSGVVHAFAVFDDGTGPALFVGGGFSSAGGFGATKLLAKWDGSAWGHVAIVSSTFSGYVRALAVHDDGSGTQLFVGGYFNGIGTAMVPNLVRWDGTNWSGLDQGIANGDVRAFGIYDEGAGPRLFIGGGFRDIVGYGFAPDVARWDGATLAPLGASPLTYSRVHPVETLATFDDGSGARLIAGGQPSSFVSPHWAIRAWDGASWGPVGTGNGLVNDAINVDPALVASLAVFDEGSGARLFAGGSFAFGDGVFVNGFASWRGNPWKSYGSNETVNRVVRAFAKFDDGGGTALYAAGDFDVAGGQNASRIAKYDGRGWAPLGGPTPQPYVRALATFDDGTGTALYAGGQFWYVGSTPMERIAKWDGTSWTPLGTGIPGTYNHWVNALLVHDDGSGSALYAGGKFQNAGGVAAADRIARWDGTAWSSLSTSVDGEVLALGEFDEGAGARLFAGGTFANAGGAPASSVARWDGTSWSALGSGTNAGVRAFATFDDGSGPALYAGGDFTVAGGVAATYIARWNGSAWSAVGGGVNSPIEELHVFDDGSGPALYAAGAFVTSAGGVTVQGIARWNGSAWSALGAGVFAGEIGALATFDDGHGDALMVGGALFGAGTQWSFNIAKWSRACTCAPVSYCTAGVTTNSCSAHITGLGTASASAGSGFDLVVSNVEGQRQGLIFYGINAPNASPWGGGSSSYLCVSLPVQRTGVQSSGGTSGTCNGAFTLDFNAYLSTHLDALGQPFNNVTTAWAQAWFRDPPAPKGTHLSDALRFDVCP